LYASREKKEKIVKIEERGNGYRNTHGKVWVRTKNPIPKARGPANAGRGDGLKETRGLMKKEMEGELFKGWAADESRNGQ